LGLFIDYLLFSGVGVARWSGQPGLRAGERVFSAWEVGGVRRVGGMMAAAALGWTRKESGMDGANSHGAGEVGQTKVYGFGVRFIVKVVEVATFNRR